MDNFDIIHEQFRKESDRACVIVAGAMLDELLRTFLLARLVPTSAGEDPLFDSVNAPLATFSARIEAAFRLGLISQQFARDLHLIRRIRNDFAHNIQGCAFDDSRVRSRVLALSRSNGIVQNSPKHFPKGEATAPRTLFLESVSWMIFFLEKDVTEIKSTDPAQVEWGYGYSHDEEYAREKAAKKRKKRRPDTEIGRTPVTNRKL